MLCICCRDGSKSRRNSCGDRILYHGSSLGNPAQRIKDLRFRETFEFFFYKATSVVLAE